LFLPRLIDELEKVGPGLSLRIRRLDSLFEIPQQALETGLFDCALGLFPWPLPPRAALLGQVLGKEDLVCISRPGHPAIQEPLSLENFAALPHLAISYPGTAGSGLLDRVLAERGLARRRVATVPHFLTLAHHVAASDCIATLPRQLAQTVARMLDLQLIEMPNIGPASNISLIWHQRVDEDPAQTWFRARLANCVASVQTAGGCSAPAG
jgi:DNA-binding transcriptional LysR family regulator